MGMSEEPIMKSVSYVILSCGLALLVGCSTHTAIRGLGHAQKRAITATAAIANAHIQLC